MTKDKYIKEISKKLLCKKDKKAEIIKQITSDIDIAVENGSKIEDVLVNMGTPSEVASEFNDNFDERDKEKILKSRKRNKVLAIVGVVVAILVIGVYLLLPTSIPLDKSKNFSEKEVIEKSKEIIRLYDEEKYDEIKSQSDEKMKSLDIKKVFSEVKAKFCSDFGDFVSYGKIYSVESSQLGKTYAVVQMSVAYKNVSATYTLSFDEDMKLAGMYIK